MQVSAIATAHAILASAVADAATFTVPYPSGTDADTFAAATGGTVAIGENDIWYEADPGFAFSYGASNITVTNDTGASLPAGTEMTISFGDRTLNGSYNLPLAATQARLAGMEARIEDLETP